MPVGHSAQLATADRTDGRGLIRFPLGGLFQYHPLHVPNSRELAWHSLTQGSLLSTLPMS